ncbi:MAG: hypothetical protein ACOVO2_18800 [Emticicia sp.]|uniref:hypothetical protein n=1 Tax=Emticicia sp. TaxID=1930953 RepID=UPI003BA5C729
MKNLELDNYGVVEMNSTDTKKTDGGIFGADDAVFWTAVAGIVALATFADYAAKELQTGYEIYQKNHKK